MHGMKPKIVTGLIICFWLSAVMTAQQITDQTVNVRGANSNTIMFSVDYSTNTNMPDNINTDVRQPSLSPSVGIISKYGFDFLMAGSVTDNSDDSLQGFSAEMDLMLGYNFDRIKNLVIYPSYTRFVYSNNAGVFNTIFDNEFRIDANYSFKVVNIGLSAGYLTGRQNTFYSVVSNSYFLTIDRLLSQNATLALQPGIDLNFGNYEDLILFTSIKSHRIRPFTITC